MKIVFEATQQFQLDAISSIVDVFAGQSPHSATAAARGGLHFANRCTLDDVDFLLNVQEVQRRNGLTPGERLAGRHFSVEMETGTGKTYVYLRTTLELAKAYGFSKFVVVVPTLAIREGVAKSIDMLRDHLRLLYPSQPLWAWTYESSRVSRLKEFATGSGTQLLVINIDAFNKDSTILNKPHDRFQGRPPIEYIASCRPIVIVDEPQELESEGSRAAVESLSPLCTLRYSATHRNPYNLLYRLDPVRAYELGLVKRIEVDSVLEEEALALPFIQVRRIGSDSKGRAFANVRIDASNATKEIERRNVTLRADAPSLYELSGRRARYKGYELARVDVRAERVRFANGVTLDSGATLGGRTDDVMRVQVRETIKAHFEKELQFAALAPGKRMKVLSLFFVDRVANYVAEDGKIKKWFDESYRALARSERYKALGMGPADRARAAYFAVSRTGASVDSSSARPTQADQDAYRLIMRDKERLLSLDEPVRFIFTHSALREGWDNPNVFQICTLNEAFSEVRKRQEIGRGLRLPVQEDGTRCFERRRNRLTVVANEYYEDFATALQREIAEDCGVEFGDRIANARKRLTVAPLPAILRSACFRELWKRLRTRTRYEVAFPDGTLIETAAARIAALPAIRRPVVIAARVELGMSSEGVTSTSLTRSKIAVTRLDDVPGDVVGMLQSMTQLSRSTIADILLRAQRFDDLVANPNSFLEQAAREIRESVRELLIRQIRYEPIDGGVYAVKRFEPFDAYEDRLVRVQKSIYPHVEVDSNVERAFATGLDAREDVELFVKLPRWFKIETPVGRYNPDWALLKIEDDGSRSVLVCETKGSSDPERLRWQAERDKIACGRAHFAVLNVRFQQVSSVDEV